MDIWSEFRNWDITQVILVLLGVVLPFLSELIISYISKRQKIIDELITSDKLTGKSGKILSTSEILKKVVLNPGVSEKSPETADGFEVEVAHVEVLQTPLFKTNEIIREKHLKKRINEVIASSDIYERDVTLWRISNSLLVFGQYIIGIALTSSFLQETLTPTWIGMLGLIVLLTTTLHQRSRPDQKMRVSQAKVNYLKSTIRTVEDQLILNPGDTLLIDKIIQNLTKSLNRIEVDDSDQWLKEELESNPDE